MKKYLNHIFLFILGIVFAVTFNYVFLDAIHSPSQAMSELKAKGVLVFDKDELSYYSNSQWITPVELESLSMLSKHYKKILVFTQDEQRLTE